METFKIILIDDEPLARALLQEYLGAHPQIQIVANCADGFEGMKAIQQHQPDLIFLDVQMPKLNGFEMLELIDEPPSVIFTTAFDEFALKAFDAQAIDYLLKPFSEERLAAAIQKFIASSKDKGIKKPLETPIIQSFQAPRVVVKDNHQIHIVPFSDIVYLEAADDYVKIHTPQRYYLKKKTMTFFEESLPMGDFCRVHRSFIIAMNQIAKVEPYEKDGAIVTLKNRVEVPVSKAGYVRLKSVLGV